MSQSSNNIFAGIGNKNTKSNNASVAPGVVEGGGGGTSLYETAFNVVNLTDGSWTLYDPDSLIQSVTFSAGYNTVTWNALSVASLNYNWAAGGEHRAPRWYKNNIIDGNQVSSMDTNVFTSLLEIDQTVNEFNQAVLMGIAVEPATTDLFTVDASGGYVIKDGPPASPAYPAWGTHQYSSATTQTAALADYGVCTIMRGGNQIGSGVFINSDGADDRAYGTGSRNSNQAVFNNSTPADTYIMLGVGVKSNTDTVVAGEKHRFRAQYISYVPDVSGATI
jgi:hypothetical protein